MLKELVDEEKLERGLTNATTNKSTFLSNP